MLVIGLVFSLFYGLNLKLEERNSSMFGIDALLASLRGWTADSLAIVVGMTSRRIGKL